MIALLALTVSNCFSFLINRSGDATATDCEILIWHYGRFDELILVYTDNVWMGEGLELPRLLLAEMWEVHPDQTIDDFKDAVGELFMIV